MRHDRVTGAAATPEVNELAVVPVAIHETPYPNRAASRHVRPMRFRNGVRVNYLVFVPKPFQLPALNQPYRKPEDA